MEPMTRWLAPLLLFVTLVLAGCGQQAVTTGGRAPEKRIRTVVSLSPSTTELVLNFAQNVQLLGRTQSCDFPPQVTSIPVVASVKPNYEEIAKIKPDLIVYDPSLYNEADVEKLRQLGIELFPIEAQTLKQFSETLTKFGAKIGAETEVSEYLDKIRQAEEGNLAEGGEKRKVAILLRGTGAEVMAAGQESFLADIVRACGYELVGPAGNKFVTINLEALAQLNPDAVVVAGSYDAKTRDPRLAAVPAIRDQRIVGFTDQGMLLRAGSRVDQLIANLRPSVEGLFQ